MADEKIYYINSTKYTTLERNTKRNGKVYDIQFRVIDIADTTLTERQRKLSGFKTKTEAKQAYTDFITTYCVRLTKELRAGIERKNREEQERQNSPTLSQAFELYLKAMEGQIKESSAVTKENRIRMHVLPYFAPETKINDICTKELYAWQDDMWAKKRDNGQHYSSEYLRSVRGAFSAFMEWHASRNERENPFKKVKRPKKRAKQKRMNFWTAEQFAQFIDVVDNPMYHTMFTMLFYTGRRIGEVMALSPSDIRRDGIIFDKTYTNKTKNKLYDITTAKTDKVGVTPICPTLRRELEIYPADHNAKFFFGGEDPIPPQTIRNNFYRYCDLAGLEKIRLHDLRHSFASMLIHEGANLMVVADLIGDTVEQVAKTYGHMYDSDKKKIISKL